MHQTQITLYIRRRFVELYIYMYNFKFIYNFIQSIIFVGKIEKVG